MSTEHKESLKAQSWCLRNDIIIYVQSVDKYKMVICVKINGGKPRIGKIEYDKKSQGQECAKKIFELYTHYYKTNKKQ